uniref:CSON000563 protein n=1 Tax=Culicoides sonorensis TaxID=179676 RepID=A0A336K5L1_CULSO
MLRQLNSKNILTLKNKLFNVCPTSCYSTKNLPDLTKDRYKVQRKNYAVPSEKDVAFFENLLQPHNVLKDINETQGYNVDWLGSLRGFSSVVIRPKTTQEISSILKYCNDNNLAVCPQGGNTGLVGGSVPVFDEVVISTTRMNEIESIDEYSSKGTNLNMI